MVVLAQDANASVQVERCTMFEGTRHGYCLLQASAAELSKFVSGNALAPEPYTKEFGNSCLALPEWGKEAGSPDDPCLEPIPPLELFRKGKAPLPVNSKNVYFRELHLSPLGRACVEFEFPYGRGRRARSLAPRRNASFLAPRVFREARLVHARFWSPPNERRAERGNAMHKAILFAAALAGAACAEQAKEPETPKQPAAGEQQMTPASGDEIEREYPPPPPPVINDQEPEDEGFDYTTTPPSDNGEYRDDVEAPPP
jgi:hypothetical protein